MDKDTKFKADHACESVQDSYKAVNWQRCMASPYMYSITN